MKLTFKKNCICRADGNDASVYKTSKRVSYSERQKAHQAFVESEMGKTFMALSASKPAVPYKPIYTEYCLYGKWYRLPKDADIETYQSGGFKLR